MHPKIFLSCALFILLKPICLQAEIKFVGVTAEAQETKLALVDTSNNTAKWVKTGEQFGDYMVANYDESAKSVTLTKDGTELRVTLTEAKIPVQPQPPPSITEYVIKPGDTAAKIARTQGISLADLQSLNPGVQWARLKVGQKIRIQ